MAIIVQVRKSNPNQLISSLNEAIMSRSVLTWAVDNMGDYTISRDQWRYLAWMRPYIEGNRIIFGIIQSRKYPMTRELYGVYHGRFVATLLSHFDTDIYSLSVTPLLMQGYDISSEY